MVGGDERTVQSREKSKAALRLLKSKQQPPKKLNVFQRMLRWLKGGREQ